MSTPTRNIFSTNDSHKSSELKHEFSLPLRTNELAFGVGKATPDSSPRTKDTHRQTPVLAGSDSRDAFQFGASQGGSEHTTDPSPSRGRGLDRSPMSFSFNATEYGNNATSGSTTSIVLNKPLISKESTVDIHGADASRSTTVFNPWALSSSYVFGSEEKAGPRFTFKNLHNVTPLPSREPSPGPSSPNSGGTTIFSLPLLTPSSSPSSVVGDRKSPQMSNILRGPQLPAAPSTLSDTTLLEPTLSIDNLAHRARSASGVSTSSDVLPDTAPPYDLRNEETPQHRFFSAEFQSALQKGLKIARDTARVVEKLEAVVTDNALTKFHETANRLRVFHGSDTRTIAVLGDSGEGKSSLINSLLHFPGVAKTGDIGSACTSVVTEYRQKTSEHTAPITIEVEYLSITEIETVLKELLWSYRQLYLPGVESDEISAQDYARYQRESAQAWSALEAAFQHKRDFRPERLQDMTEGALERITSQLVQWSQEIEWPSGGADGIWKSTANTAEECSEKTELFMADRYWPFTKIIRIYLNAQVLKTGVVLADLPGLQDTNLARVRATQDYLMKCNNIFIVAKISRAITDQSLKTSLFTVLSRHVPLEWEESAAKSLNVAVVCTKSEDIDIDTSRREFCGTGKSISPMTVKELDKKIDDAKMAGDSQLKKRLKLSRELMFINARNEHVTKGLQNAYASKVPDKKLEVFCVSNKMYGKYTRKGNSEIVNCSGIPSLRKFCHSITAEAQLREAKHFLQSSLFSLLNSLHIWACSSVMNIEDESFESREVYAQLEDVKTLWTQSIRDLSSEFKSCFEEQVLKMQEHRHSDWEKAAASQGREWFEWHWSQYNSWCLNNGNHATPKREHVDWNAKVIWKMRTELEFQWDLVEEEISTLFSNHFDKIKGLLEKMQLVIEEFGPAEFAASLIEGIESRIKHCEYTIGLYEQRFTRDFKLTRRYASESNDNSFILQQMLPAYREASNQFAISERINSAINSVKKELKELQRQTLEGLEEDIDNAISYVSDGSMAAEDQKKVEELIEVVNGLKDEAEAVGRIAAQ